MTNVATALIRGICTMQLSFRQINREQGDASGAAQDVAPAPEIPQGKDHSAEAAS